MLIVGDDDDGPTDEVPERRSLEEARAYVTRHVAGMVVDREDSEDGVSSRVADGLIILA
ncbi:hypothetical protein GLOTRDRAFT_134720 [Gloeophyllum trabeum ATCC 11539]|uniref:Uncharacterized protein n=1 Tax=Gloeophyllum trabeum (strain ATCC 11539 / FP-39264 / Madison 617) TaxID=670483 RepID=S7PQR2_GLOTA|nr:uncharacterized protein GLOTRDRAFT_134720 [Gloeophyllum trabeum ATCC 11539]EPQ49702.1 hypothetical protein GLOTRDRAFT_134720 [Gloeophyllum trabeum ATCC 11539]